MSIRPIIIIDDPVVKTKDRQITIYKQELFEDMDAESIKFTELRPDLPSHQSDIIPETVIQNVPYVLTKEREVTINKQRLYEDIDSESYKYADAQADLSTQQGNATSSDTAERLDGHIIARLVEHCDAKLRKRLMRYIKNATEVISSNDDMVLDSSFVYTFILSTEFNDSMMEPFTNYIHRYLVWGALYDWYGASVGSNQAKWFEKTLKETEDAIVKLVARIDGHLAVRHLEFRDAKLRRRMSLVLKNTDEIINANDKLNLGATFVYDLVLPEEFKDSMIGPLKDYIHRYLVWGALYDWYGSSLGSNQANFYKGELTELENAIVGLITLPNMAKRPLQPFGPAQKIY